MRKSKKKMCVFVMEKNTFDCKKGLTRRGGEISPRKNFGGQISSRNSHQIFPGRFKKIHQIFPAQNLSGKKNFGAFSAISFCSYVFPYGLREKTHQIFPGRFKKTHQIFPAQNLSPTKFFPPRYLGFSPLYITYVVIHI